MKNKTLKIILSVALPFIITRSVSQNTLTITETAGVSTINYPVQLARPFVKGEIASSGECEWTVQAAKELGVDVRVIEDALNVRKESADVKNQQKFSNKIVALLRKHFGGHGVKSEK